MRPLAEWSYVQARLQARHGARLGEPEWRMLEAAKTQASLLEKARSTSLRRFINRIDDEMTSHAIERILRFAWHSYVAEIGSWTPPAWRRATLWVSYVPDLVVLDRLLAGETASWLRDDPLFGPLVDVEHDRRLGKLRRSPFFPLAAAPKENGLGESWRAHWRTLWPQRCGFHYQRPLEKLADLVKAHVSELAEASVEESSQLYRQKLAHALTRMFRRCGGTPAAAFCHLALVALDVERLRGSLVRRRSFDTEYDERSG
jgi:hypothetical protein